MGADLFYKPTEQAKETSLSIEDFSTSDAATPRERLANKHPHGLPTAIYF